MQVRYLLFETASLVENVTKEEAGTTMEGLRDFIVKCDVGRLEKLGQDGVKMWSVLQPSKTVMYVPTGFLLCEKVVKGLLVYGARQSWLLHSEDAVKNYAAITKLHTESKSKGAAKMTETLHLLDSIGAD